MTVALAVRDAPPALLPGVWAVFWRTSARVRFADRAAQMAFADLWLGWYLRLCPETTWLIPGGPADPPVLGYVAACTDTRAAPESARTQKATALFADLWPRFPGHLHINVHPAAQGRGLGRLLIETATTGLAARACPGVHVITAPDAKNYGFYNRMGFATAVQRPLGPVPLLFLGRSLRGASPGDIPP